MKKKRDTIERTNLNLKRRDKMLLQHVAFIVYGKIFKSCTIRTIPAPTRNDEFELPYGSYIQDYFKHVIKKHDTVINNLLIRLHLKLKRNII